MSVYVILTPRLASRLYHGTIGLAILALTALFWFAGSVAVAAQFPIHCDNGFCHLIQATCAFGFFLWAIFTGLAIIEGLAGRGGRYSGKV